jgi:hypothetical protein
MTETPQTDKCVKANKHLKFLQEDVWVNDNKITYENPIVALCQKLERERDRLAEAINRILELTTHDDIYWAIEEIGRLSLTNPKIEQL